MYTNVFQYQYQCNACKGWSSRNIFCSLCKFFSLTFSRYLTNIKIYTQRKIWNRHDSRSFEEVSIHYRGMGYKRNWKNSLFKTPLNICYFCVKLQLPFTKFHMETNLKQPAIQMMFKRQTMVVDNFTGKALKPHFMYSFRH